MSDYLPDGVYLGLSPDVYFAQDRIGSSDLIKLHQHREGWWWQSNHNPDAKRSTSREQNYGSALHAIILEGIDAYERAFAVEPDPKIYGLDLVTTTDQIKGALIGAGYSMKGTSGFSKADWAREIMFALPGRPCWENIYTEFKARIGTRSIISAAEDRMLRLMHQIATEPREDNAVIARLLANTEEHPALAEVSIFATVDGVRRRWRIDRMYPALDMDLKSLGAWRGRPLPHETGQILAQNGWDVQRADYFRGRGEAYRLINAGHLFGGTVEQRRYIRQIVAEHPTWDWLWMVYQKPASTGRAPVLFPIWDDSFGPVDPYSGERPMGELLKIGLAKAARATAFYRSCMAKFGPDRPWARVDPLHYTDENREPRIFIPHWIASDDPTEAEAYPDQEPES